MSAILPIDVDGLLRNRGVESERVELKASWDPATTGPQVLRTICAFANDYHNLNGGYVVIGAAERDGRAVLPPKGLSDAEVEAAQKWILGNCKRIDPPYVPVLSPETVEDRRILVVWAPASDAGAHRAPDGRDPPRHRYWIRLGAETVDAEGRGGLLTSFLRQKTGVPWDDRPARGASVEDMSETRVREHLRSAGSGLLREPDARSVYRRMRIVSRVNGREAPRNVGLLFFARDPGQWFRCATIEVVQFASDRGGDTQEERTFRGGLSDRLRECLNYLGGLSTGYLQKSTSGFQSRRWESYPLAALREIVVNAAYHSGYDESQPEPIKVYLFPGRIEVASYPGPVPGIERRHFLPGAEVPSAPARNRRIGEFLKDLELAEARLSGLPKVFKAMEDNGSPPPSFDFDEGRTWFRAVLRAHPQYEALSAARDAAELRVVGDREGAFRRIESAWESNPASPLLAVEAIRACVETGDAVRAGEVFRTFAKHAPESAVPRVADALASYGDRLGAERARRRARRPEPAL